MSKVDANLQWLLAEFIFTIILIASWPDNPTGKAGLFALVYIVANIAFWTYVGETKTRLPKIIRGKDEQDR